MTISLLEGNKKFVFMGDWDAAEFARYAHAIPLSDYREVAQQLGDKLENSLDSRSKNINLEPKAKGLAFSKSINSSLITTRSREKITKCADTHAAGVKSMSDISQGLIKPEEIAEAASDIVSHLMTSFASDASLLNNMTNLKVRNEYIYTHSINTAILAINIATAMELDEKQVREVGIGGLLHNLGMSMVPEQVLNADHKISPAEHIDVQKHIGYGLYLLERLRGLPPTTRLILFQNKERLDGSGYPRRHTKNATHKFSRIVAVADVYDAMSTDRPWRKAHHPYRTMEYLLSQAHKKFDAEAIKGLLRYMSLFPIGSFVALDNGDIARVVHSNHDDYSHPIVSVLFDEKRKAYAPPEILDLHTEPDAKVASVLEDELNLDDYLGFA